MIKVCLNQIRNVFISPRFYIAIIIGCIMQIVSLIPLSDYADAINKQLCIFEGFIYFNCDIYITSAAILASFIMVSDVPYALNSELFPIIRLSRKKWLLGKCLYLFSVCVIYYCIIAFCGGLFLMKNSYIGNVWSTPIINLSNDTYGSLYAIYKTYFPYSHILQLNPIVAFTLCFLLSILYAYTLSLILFYLNLIFTRKTSFFLGIMFHVINYVFVAILPPVNYKRISLLANSMIVYHNIGNSSIGKQFPSIPQSICVFASIITLFVVLLLYTIKKYDFRLSEIEK